MLILTACGHNSIEKIAIKDIERLESAFSNLNHVLDSMDVNINAIYDPIPFFGYDIKSDSLIIFTRHKINNKTVKLDTLTSRHLFFFGYSEINLNKVKEDIIFLATNEIESGSYNHDCRVYFYKYAFRSDDDFYTYKSLVLVKDSILAKCLQEKYDVHDKKSNIWMISHKYKK